MKEDLCHLADDKPSVLTCSFEEAPLAGMGLILITVLHS